MPCGVIIHRKHHIERIENHIEYLNSPDTTIMGSRNGQAVSRVQGSACGVLTAPSASLHVAVDPEEGLGRLQAGRHGVRAARQVPPQ